VGNLVSFFDRFRSLNIGSSKELEDLVAEAQRVVRGVTAQDLRDSRTLRQRVTADLAGVTAAVDGLMVDRPRRRIIRPTPSGA
jgi:hypothetical protein